MLIQSLIGLRGLSQPRDTEGWVHRCSTIRVYRQGFFTVLPFAVIINWYLLLQQAIHPSQVDVIKAIFIPTPEGEIFYNQVWSFLISSLEIKRAVKILQAMKAAHESQQGAIALDGQMIDAPMIKQVCYLRRLHYPAE